MTHPNLNPDEEQKLLELCASWGEKYVEWSESKFWKHISRLFIRDDYSRVSPSQVVRAVEEVQRRKRKRGGRWFGGWDPDDLDHALLKWEEVLRDADHDGWRMDELEPSDGSDNGDDDDDADEHEDDGEKDGEVDEVESERHRKAREYKAEMKAQEEVFEASVRRWAERRNLRDSKYLDTGSSREAMKDEKPVEIERAGKKKPEIIILSDDEDDGHKTAPSVAGNNEKTSFAILSDSMQRLEQAVQEFSREAHLTNIELRNKQRVASRSTNVHASKSTASDASLPTGDTPVTTIAQQPYLYSPSRPALAAVSPNARPLSALKNNDKQRSSRSQPIPNSTTPSKKRKFEEESEDVGPFHEIAELKSEVHILRNQLTIDRT